MDTYLTREKFDRGCMLTGNQRSWCASADGLRDVRPGTEPGNARFIVRQRRDATAAAIIGRDHTDFACCSNHIFDYVDFTGEDGWTSEPGWTVFKLDEITFAAA